MKYFGDVQFGLVMVIAIAAMIMLGSSVRLRGKGLLLGFIILEILTYAGLYIPHILLRNEVMNFEVYDKFMEPASVVLGVISVLRWGLLLAFIISLRTIAQPGGVMAGGEFAEGGMTVARALFSFEGRLCRSDYWLKGFLPMFAVGILNNVMAYGVHKDWARMLSLAIALFSFWPGLALIVKRLHDCDHSGWFALIMLIPIVGPLILLVIVWFRKGTDGPNRFGPDPLRPAQPLAPASWPGPPVWPGR